MTINHDRTTRGIKNCRDSRLFKGCSPLQLLCNLTGNHSQSATFHTAKPLVARLSDDCEHIDGVT